MSKRVDAWECQVCKTAFFDKELADKCEKIHLLEENLEIVEIREYRQEEEFPKIILVSNKDSSGHLAQYKFDYESSIEDFYEDEDCYEY